jgi:hypothetical protein
VGEPGGWLLDRNLLNGTLRQVRGLGVTIKSEDLSSTPSAAKKKGKLGSSLGELYLACPWRQCDPPRCYCRVQTQSWVALNADVFL